MRLSKTAYHADFAIYALAVGGLGLGAALLNTTWLQRIHWLTAFAVAALAWTLLEYLLHGFVLHRIQVFAAMHAVHHDSPRAYVGTPTWFSLGVIWLVIFLPAWRGISLNLASGMTAGVMMGFLWYGIVHHVIHYRRPRFLAGWMVAGRRWHLRHHYATQAGNFGVTTPLWDYVFGTVIREDRAAPRCYNGNPSLGHQSLTVSAAPCAKRAPQ